MKLTKIISMVAAVATAGFCMSAAAAGTEGQSGTLTLTDPETNVNVTATAQAPVGGAWNVIPDVEGSGVNAYYAIDCDAASSNLFTATSRTTNKIVKCEFTLQPAPVPCTSPSSLPAPDSGAQVAFCIATNTTSGAVNPVSLNAYVKNGGANGWQTLAGSIPTNEYTLTITFDYTATPAYVKFAIDGNDLQSGTWYSAAATTNGVNDYCFIGDGKLKSILTTGQNVAAEAVDVGGVPAEKVVVNGENVTIPETQFAAVEALATGSETVAQVLAADASEKFSGSGIMENVTVADAIALGLVAPNTAGTALEVKKTAVKVSGNALATGNDIKISVNVSEPPAGSNATVKYTLMGSANGSDFSEIENYTNLSAVPSIPTDKIGTGSGKFLFFKVKVSVTYPNN